jgi:DNA-directed RNA polymerase specialized sigma24 family protein
VSKNDAISSIAKSKSLKSMAYKFVGSSNYEDLFQEMLLRLLNMPEERIIELQENKQLERYAYGIMTMKHSIQITSSESYTRLTL